MSQTINKIDERNVVFRPVKGTSQELALDTRADQTLLCGTRGSMKTATQLMYFRQFVGIGYGQFWKGLIFDREFKNLTDLIAQSKKFFLPFGDCTISESTSGLKCRWTTGEELQYRHMKKLQDYSQIHGFEFCFIGVNELTNQANLELYDKVCSTNRSSFIPEKDTPMDKNGKYLTRDGKPLPPIPLKIFSTCNPSGIGHNAVKSRFITPAPYGKLVKRDVDIFNPQTGKEEVYTKTQVAIFASYRENPFMPPSYAAELASITDPNLRLAWEGGSWDVTCGGALDDLWSKDIHIIDRFKIPDNWHIKRCFDWGSSHPFAVLWIAESNGEEVNIKTIDKGGVEIITDTFCAPKGSLIVIDEWYGAVDIAGNKGLKLSAKEIAQGILENEADLINKKWISTTPYPGAADNQISNVREKDVETIEKKMADLGVLWTESDKSKGSRVNGLQLIRDMLESSLTGEGQGLYFFRNCTACIETIPSLPRDEDNTEDIDTASCDHLYDALRYGVLEGQNRIEGNLNMKIFT